MLLEKHVSEKAEAVRPHEDEPLPATLTFVMGLGIAFTVLWFAMYVLLRSRW